MWQLVGGPVRAILSRRRSLCLAVVFAACGLFSAHAGAQPALASSELNCLWDGLGDAEQSSVNGSVRRLDDGLGQSPLTDGMTVRLQSRSHDIAAALTPEVMASCGLADATDKMHRLAVAGLAFRAQVNQAKGELAALEGEPDAVDEIFERLPDFRREELADWAWRGGEASDAESSSAFWRALGRARVNRTFAQRRIMAMGFLARLGEYRAGTCLTLDSAGQTACLDARYRAAPTRQ